MANLFSNSIGVYSTNQDDFHTLFVIHFHAKREPHNNSREILILHCDEAIFFLSLSLCSLADDDDAAASAEEIAISLTFFLFLVITTIFISY